MRRVEMQAEHLLRLTSTLVCVLFTGHPVHPTAVIPTGAALAAAFKDQAKGGAKVVPAVVVDDDTVVRLPADAPAAPTSTKAASASATLSSGAATASSSKESASSSSSTSTSDGKKSVSSSPSHAAAATAALSAHVAAASCAERAAALSEPERDFMMAYMRALLRRRSRARVRSMVHETRMAQLVTLPTQLKCAFRCFPHFTAFAVCLLTYINI